MTFRYRTLALLAIVTAAMPIHSVQAQLRGARSERDRGLLGRASERREDRLNRNAPQPPPANPNAARGPGQPPQPGQAGGPLSQNAANRLPPANPNSPGAAGANSATTLNRNNANAVGGLNPASPQVRSAYFADPSGAAANNAVNAASAMNPANVPGPVVNNTAAPANRLPYTGPGVMIRLPRDVGGEVNYLVDNVEHLLVHAARSKYCD